MDYLEKGKSLAKNGQHEEALEALALAYENDKENPDIHFFIGLCYSAQDRFEYAKYHYEMALRLDPQHEKTNLMMSSLSSYTAKKPPEQRLIRKAQAEERRAQDRVTQEEEPASSKPHEYDLNPKLQKNLDPEVEEKWEEAFPTSSLQYDDRLPLVHRMLIVAITAGILGVITYFVYAVFLSDAG